MPGVTMRTSPRAGMTAAVVRSERRQRMPVKYSSEAPDSMSSAPILRSAISAAPSRYARAARRPRWRTARCRSSGLSCRSPRPRRHAVPCAAARSGTRAGVAQERAPALVRHRRETAGARQARAHRAAEARISRASPA